MSHGWRKDGADFSLLPKFREPENADISSPVVSLPRLREERERESGKLVGGIFRRWGGRCFFEIQWADLTRLEARLNNNKRYA